MELQFKLIIGSDLAGYDLKTEMIKRMTAKGYDISDAGCYSSQEGEYPFYAKKVAEAVVKGDYDRGILICGTGQGMAIAANKVKGARAALCYLPFTAIMSREHNNANILTTGAWLVSADEFEKIIEIWLFGKYTPGKHDGRIQALKDIEEGR
ncbi:MAG: ribose 5-phosphate isomerase B [Clostridia bacterium]|nr:ribose 5-phosphate isomerase B [Clostridia bacterium]